MTTQRITVDELKREAGPAAMRILALDPANALGFAHTNGNRGTIQLARKGDGHEGDRLLRLANWLRATVTHHPVDLIAAEDASFGSHHDDVKAMHNQLKGIILLVAAELRIPTVFLNPVTIKVFATNRGKAKKHHMIAACKRLLGITPRTSDEADALWILELARRPDCWNDKAKNANKPRVRKKSASIRRKLIKDLFT